MTDMEKLTHGITISKKIVQEVWEEITLTGRDIEDWLDHCEDITLLKYLSRIAWKKARRLEEPDDYDIMR